MAMTRVLCHESALGLTTIFRVNLVKSSSPVEWFHETRGEWVPTGYTSAQCHASKRGLERIARIVLASWGVTDCRFEHESN